MIAPARLCEVNFTTKTVNILPGGILEEHGLLLPSIATASSTHVWPTCLPTPSQHAPATRVVRQWWHGLPGVVRQHCKRASNPELIRPPCLASQPGWRRARRMRVLTPLPVAPNRCVLRAIMSGYDGRRSNKANAARARSESSVWANPVTWTTTPSRGVFRGRRRGCVARAGRARDKSGSTPSWRRSAR